jgi:hypothetical protein
MSFLDRFQGQTATGTAQGHLKKAERGTNFQAQTTAAAAATQSFSASTGWK